VFSSLFLYTKIVNQLNINLTRKRYYLFLYQRTNSNLKISKVLSIFKKIGFIKYFYFYKSSLLIIYNFVWNTLFYRSLRVLSTISKKIFLSLKSILIGFKFGYDLNIYFMTSKGVLNFKAVKSQKLGGIAWIMLM